MRYVLWKESCGRGKYTEGHVSSERGVAGDREGFAEKVTGKLGVECLFHRPKAEMSQMASPFTTVSPTEKVLNLNWMIFWVQNVKLSGKLGEFILSWSSGGVWIGIFSTDCPGKNPLMNPVKIQINTSLKYSFVLFPCQEVYVSGWGVVPWASASYGKQLSWRERHHSDWSQGALPVAFSSACESDKLHVPWTSLLTQILIHSSQKWK